MIGILPFNFLIFMVLQYWFIAVFISDNEQAFDKHGILNMLAMTIITGAIFIIALFWRLLKGKRKL
jgi:hypothetical protein